MTPRSLVILGSGYTGRILLPQTAQHYRFVYCTSREPERHLAHVPRERRLLFDLAKPETWQNIPANADLLWCFPATPLDLVRQCTEAVNAASRKLVVLGSTSAYDVGCSQEYPPNWIDETAPIDLSKARVQGEEYLRKACQAIILRVAGIYGPGRNPLDWIRTGRVTASRKFVNLIHVEDLAGICLAAIEHGKPGEIYNVSDGTPRAWKEICTIAKERWNVLPRPGQEPDATGKRIETNKLRRDLGIRIHHANLFDELEWLDQRQATNEATP
ncbi:MAG TPA: hypothetical protein VIR79_06095 [Nitrospira sp.]